jgi:hypothetical protein
MKSIAMPRKPIGTSPMTATERSRRRRAKAKALRDAAQKAIQSASAQPASSSTRTASSAGRPDNPGPDDYPRMLYHPDGRTTIVETAEEHDRLTPDGWGTIPLAVHQQRPVTHHGFLGAAGNDPLAATIREVMRSVLDEYDLSNFVTPEVSKRFGEI